MADSWAEIDANSRQSLTAASTTDGTTIVRLYADPTSHRLLVTDGASGATATTWGGSGGNTSTVTDATVTASSIVVFMCATPPHGFWGVVCGSGTFTITSSDSENANLAFTYKIFS